MLKPAVRNILLITLTMTAGCVDAISFVQFGQVFTAAMTGNAVLLGLSMSQLSRFSTIRYAIAISGFILGAATAGVVHVKQRDNDGWTPLVTMTLAIEFLELVLFAIIAYAVPHDLIHHWTYLYILLLSMAMGVQGSAARRIGVTEVPTTVITSTLTGMIENIVWQIRDHFVPVLHRQYDEHHGRNVSPPASVWMWIVSVFFYGAGAGICGLWVRHISLHAIWLPLALVAFVLCFAGISQFRKTHETKHKPKSFAHIGVRKGQ